MVSPEAHLHVICGLGLQPSLSSAACVVSCETAVGNVVNIAPSEDEAERQFVSLCVVLREEFLFNFTSFSIVWHF